MTRFGGGAQDTFSYLLFIIPKILGDTRPPPAPRSIISKRTSVKPGSREPFLFDKFSLTSFICPCEQGKLQFFHLSSLLV